MKRTLVAIVLLVFNAAVATAQTPDSLQTLLNRAIAQYDRGDRQGAAREFARLANLFNAAGANVTGQALVAMARAATYLGAEDPQAYKTAMAAYDRALEVDPNNLEARVRLAELFLEKYNSGEAKRTLSVVLAREPNYVPALLLDAKRRDFDHEAGADSLVEKALRLEPENPDARLLRGRFLADIEDYAGAIRETDRALRARPDHAEALAFGAALRNITGDSAGYTELRRRFAAKYPREAGVQVAQAELLSRVRQYAKAAAAAREGTQIDPSSWRAHTLLGTNLLRLGDVDGGKRALERAFEGDPYDVWTKNTLDLLDTFDDYDVITRGPFRFMIEKAESGVLGVYLGDLAEQAHATFVRRYGFTPAPPIRMEVYRSHADFSVRTVGLAGLGALGVSFGNTVAFDSPAAKDAGTFNWASTAWHELAHTFTLGASDMRVPRWLSEGLSVFEERRGRKGWGQGVTPAFLQAYMDGKLYPVSRLNDGFVRPQFPQQVILSYYEASLVCEMIVRDFGEQALMAMLREYRSGAGTEQVVKRVLKIDLPALDHRFDAYVRERFGTAMAALKDRSYVTQVALGEQLLRRGDNAGAIAALERGRTLFPEYGGAESVYPPLARALIAAGEKRRAADVLVAMTALGDVPYETHLELADLLLELGDTTHAADALESAMYMQPYEVKRHEQLATLYQRLGNQPKRLRERRAVVALKPVDLAEAQFQLALAYRDAGDLREARRSVLRALEDAPNFERAQELLLALHERKSP